MEQQTNPNAPTARQGLPRAPERRHYAARLNAKSVRHTARNTVIMPWVEVETDVQMIRDGLAMRDGNTFTVNDRVYVLEPNRRPYPREGDGFYVLSRGAYRAVSLYNDGELRMDAEQMLDLEAVSEDDRTLARRVQREIDDWRRGR